MSVSDLTPEQRQMLACITLPALRAQFLKDILQNPYKKGEQNIDMQKPLGRPNDDEFIAQNSVYLFEEKGQFSDHVKIVGTEGLERSLLCQVVRHLASTRTEFCRHGISWFSEEGNNAGAETPIRDHRGRLFLQCCATTSGKHGEKSTRCGKSVVFNDKIFMTTPWELLSGHKGFKAALHLLVRNSPTGDKVSEADRSRRGWREIREMLKALNKTYEAGATFPPGAGTNHSLSSREHSQAAADAKNKYIPQVATAPLTYQRFTRDNIFDPLDPTSQVRTFPDGLRRLLPTELARLFSLEHLSDTKRITMCHVHQRNTYEQLYYHHANYVSNFGVLLLKTLRLRQERDPNNAVNEQDVQNVTNPELVHTMASIMRPSEQSTKQQVMEIFQRHFEAAETQIAREELDIATRDFNPAGFVPLYEKS